MAHHDRAQDQLAQRCAAKSRWTSTGETPARLELRAFFQSVTVRKFLSRQSGSVVSFSRLLHAALTQTSKPILPR
jgi:hypothetical protein